MADGQKAVPSNPRPMGLSFPSEGPRPRAPHIHHAQRPSSNAMDHAPNDFPRGDCIPAVRSALPQSSASPSRHVIADGQEAVPSSRLPAGHRTPWRLHGGRTSWRTRRNASLRIPGRRAITEKRAPSRPVGPRGHLTTLPRRSRNQKTQVQFPRRRYRRPVFALWGSPAEKPPRGTDMPRRKKLGIGHGQGSRIAKAPKRLTVQLV